MGMETEYAIRYEPVNELAPERPRKETVFQYLGAALVERLGGAVGKDGYFLGNGSAISLELPFFEELDSGLFEMATPECAGPAQLLLYQLAQDRILEEVLPHARIRLGEEWHYHGSLGLLKNCKDARDEVYGVQENYEAEIGAGYHLWLRRLLLFPLTVPVLTIALLDFLLFYGCRLYIRTFGVAESREAQLHNRVTRFSLQVAERLVKPLVFLLRKTCFVTIRKELTTFLVSRVIFIGPGTLNSDGTFELSERADSINCVVDSLNIADKCLIWIGHIGDKALKTSMGDLDIANQLRRTGRLQLGCSEANLCQRAEYLKLATTCLVLDMIESGFLRDTPQLVDPVQAIKTVSKDLSLRASLELKDGSRLSALELQRWYLERARQFVAESTPVSLEARRLVELWEETLNQLETEPSKLFGSLDWVTKRILIARSQDQPIEVRKKIDLKYHEIGVGYYRQLESAGAVERLVDEKEVRRAMREAPQDTPALSRSRAIQQLSGQEAVFDWHQARLGQSYKGRILPFRRPAD